MSVARQREGSPTLGSKAQDRTRRELRRELADQDERSRWDSYAQVAEGTVGQLQTNSEAPEEAATSVLPAE